MNKQNGSNNLLEPDYNTLIRYPHFRELHQHISRCQYVSREASEPQCIALEGPTGAGKSTLVKDYTASFPRRETDTGTIIPVFYIETPSPVTMKALGFKMLRQLGDPLVKPHDPQWSIDERLINLIKDCGVELVIVDDFHHLFDLKTKRVLEQVSDWLKVLIKETGKCFLVVGTEGTVSAILDANAQLSRLFIREELPAFRWDGTNQKAIKDFAKFVKRAEVSVGMPLPWKGDNDIDLLYRIHYATHGVVGNIMKLLQHGVVVAQAQGQATIEIAILAQVFDEFLMKHLKLIAPLYVVGTNPFKGEEQFVAPQPPPKEQEAGKKGSVASVLSTK